jgi:hypothetical protein
MRNPYGATLQGSRECSRRRPLWACATPSGACAGSGGQAAHLSRRPTGLQRLEKIMGECVGGISALAGHWETEKAPVYQIVN